MSVKELSEVAERPPTEPRAPVADEAVSPAVFLREAVTTREAAMTAIAILIFVFFSIKANHFLTISNVLDIARATAFIGIVAIAWTYLLIAGELDLSVGSIYGFGTILLGWLIAGLGLSPWLAAGLILAYGVAIGLVNGIITVYIGVRAFVVTLGMLSLLRGAALAMSGNFPISYPRDLKSAFFTVGGGSLAGIPVQAIWFACVTVIGAVILARTKFGYWVYATGGNEAAAREMGIPTKRIRVVAFILVAFACALIAILQGAWLRSASPSTGIGFELQVIGAVLIGGASLSGGDGSVWGTVVGAVILGMVTNGLVLFGFPPASGLLASGAIIMVAGIIDVVLRRTGGRLAGQTANTRATLLRSRE
jgi:ribose/xylose/arabinose/galactoside ABC-type transport system permease subunit